eukprot:TRINITY_DN1569_c0_g1_i6.p1 TRINITY_DN1569_c0_g1~~TRINITY_DN1569_c0_g1_i6.p1  ORF type:complete len:178 (+),score=10.74 TRINITY_DN1569_c0_g1_i6:138-671(+)
MIRRLIGRGKTYSEVIERQKKDMLEHSMKTFNRVMQGVHGRELPKFAENPEATRYWKLKTNSNVTLSERRYEKDYRDNSTRVRKAKNDSVKLEITYVPIKKNRQVSNKINDMTNLAILQSVPTPRLKASPRCTSTIKQPATTSNNKNNNSAVIGRESFNYLVNTNRLLLDASENFQT